MGIRKVLQSLRESEGEPLPGGPAAGGPAHVHVIATPNPDARKFSVERPLVTEGSATFQHPLRTDAPPLVVDLLAIPGVRALFFLGDFCTVTKDAETPWEDVTSAAIARLQAHLAEGEPLTPPRVDPAEMGDVERRIHELIQDVIRPAVQRDGGDIVFAGYDAGRVQLYMQGSCSGCPSSRVTLKMGVENLLREEIPEVREVVALE